MRPELFRLFDVGFPSYFVLLLSGFVFATALGVLWARRIGLNPDVIVDLGLAMLLAGVAGSRILHVLADGYFWTTCTSARIPSQVDWPLNRAECVSPVYDGVWDAAQGRLSSEEQRLLRVGEVLGRRPHLLRRLPRRDGAAVFLLRRDRFPFWKAADMAGFAIPMGLAFGRMGVSSRAAASARRRICRGGSRSRRDSPASEAQAKAHLARARACGANPVHPTQIYESAASLAIAAFCLLRRAPRKRYDGQVFAASLVLYAAARFLVDKQFLSVNRSPGERPDYSPFINDRMRQIVAEVYERDIATLGYTFDNSSLIHQLAAQNYNQFPYWLNNRFSIIGHMDSLPCHLRQSPLGRWLCLSFLRGHSR